MTVGAPSTQQPDPRPLLFCLHCLGGSARSWRAVEALLGDRVRLVAIDLPGFGDAAAVDAYPVSAMADYVTDTIRRHAPVCWMLAGHSMGAKVAALIARRSEDRQHGLGGLQHLLLLAGSPPCPEPMQDDRRSRMLGCLEGPEETRREQADGFILANVVERLQDEHHHLAVGEVLRAERNAWVAWLEHGSREDWADRIGRLRTPALIVAGAMDGDLGPDAQRRLMAPHFHEHRIVVLENAAHLLPLECADAIAALIGQCADRAVLRAKVGAPYWEVLQSDRVSAATRAALLARALPAVSDAGDGLLDERLRATLAALLARVIPQQGPYPIDLGAALIAELAAPDGDGWRYADLPCDLEAWRAGLRTLDAGAKATGAADFASLPGTGQDRLLERAAAGTLEAAGPETLNAPQMRLWFEEVRAGATRAYAGHPATLSRIGFSGIAYGGDGQHPGGFTQFGIGVREPWEPAAHDGGGERAR